MKRLTKIATCAFLILLSVSVNVYAILWPLWNVPVSVRIGPVGPRSTDLSVFCSPSAISIGDTTTIHGKLVNATSREAITGQTISLYYKSNEGGSWNYITSVQTIFDGTYSYLWIDASTLTSGYYVVNATFTGSIDFDGWTSVTDLQVIPTAPPIKPDFEISVSPSFQSVNPGSSASYTINVNPLGEYSSEVSLSSEWIGTPPTDAVGQLSPTKVTPPGTSTLTVTPSLNTALGQYTINITGRSGYITHSKTVTLIVGKAIEIEINPFWIEKDCDTLSDDDWHGAADPYFKMKLAGDDEWFRSPKDGKEVWIGEDQIGNSFLGPIYIPRKLVKFPASLMIQAWDNDPFSDDSLGEKTFIINELPFVDKMENDEIYMLVTVREAPATLFNKVYQVDDQRNSNQWYWFEVGANLVWKGIEEGEYSLDEVIVAVIDTGVNYTHPDLDANIWQNLDEIPNNNDDDDGNGFIDDWNGFDFVDGYQDILGWHQDEDGPMDKGFISEGIRFYHGTEIAGILAAERNDIGIVGVSPNVKIMPIRVLSEHQLSHPFKIGEAIRYAADNGAKVISMSFEKNSGTSLYLDDIEYAYKSGVTLVAAAGNDRSSREVYPAAFEKVVSASGLSRVEWVSNDQLSYTYTPSEISYLMLHDDLSNYGPSLLNPKLSIEFSAPSMLLDTTSTSPPFTWATMGTSYSSPIVSAVAAVVIGYVLHNYPDVELNPNEIRYILKESANDLGPVGWDPYHGYGMVNAYQALQKVDELLGSEGWQIGLDPPGNLDLHVYDMFGRHTGLNYQTGELEVEIPGAIHTGDETGGFETIFLPLEETDFQIKIVNRDPPDPVEFTLNIASFDASGNLIMEETRYGSVQANSEVAYTVEATETGYFDSHKFSITVDKFFKPSEIGSKRKGAVMSRTNITNAGELDLAELSFEDNILEGWTIKDGDHTISVTLFINGTKYEIPYDELDYVAVESGKYVVYVNFTASVDLYQSNTTSGKEEYRMTIYAFEPGWVLEIKYPMHPPTDLLAGDYEQGVLVTFVNPHGITVTVKDTAVLHVI